MNTRKSQKEQKEGGNERSKKELLFIIVAFLLFIFLASREVGTEGVKTSR